EHPVDQRRGLRDFRVVGRGDRGRHRRNPSGGRGFGKCHRVRPVSSLEQSWGRREKKDADYLENSAQDGKLVGPEFSASPKPPTGALVPHEFDSIARLRSRTPADPRVTVGPGDDAAVLAPLAGPLLVTTDMLMDGTDFV